MELTQITMLLCTVFSFYKLASESILTKCFLMSDNITPLVTHKNYGFICDTLTKLLQFGKLVR